MIFLLHTANQNITLHTDFFGKKNDIHSGWKCAKFVVRKDDAQEEDHWAARSLCMMNGRVGLKKRMGVLPIMFTFSDSVASSSAKVIILHHPFISLQFTYKPRKAEGDAPVLPARGATDQGKGGLSREQQRIPATVGGPRAGRHPLKVEEGSPQ